MPFSFNQESSLLLIGFTQGIVYSTLLLWRGIRERRLSDRILAILILVICCHISHYMLGFAGWFNNHDAYTSFMFYFPIENMLLVGPLVYYYFRSLTNRDFHFRRNDWFHFIPGFLHLGLYLAMFVSDIVISHWMSGDPLTCFYETKGNLACWYESEIEPPLQVIWAISILYYLLRTLRDYQRYRKYLNDNFSEQEFIRFGWLRNLLLVLTAGIAITWAFDLVGIFLWAELSHPVYWNTHLAMAIVVYFIGIQGYHHIRKLKDLNFDEVSSTNEEEANHPNNSSENAAVPNEPKENKEIAEDLKELKQRLAQYMEDEKPFLNPELKMKELASVMQTNPSILSRVINTGFGQNFNDFINSRRVEAVKQRLADPTSSQYSLLGIAEQCGFNSKSTFNRAFKKFSGTSPRDYMGQQQAQ